MSTSRSWATSPTAAGVESSDAPTDNGARYRSHAFRDALAATGVTRHLRTRPYRPQLNGKVERFNHTLLDEWGYARPYRSETERHAAFTDWLHSYNHRGHTALGGHPPASRVTNLSGEYIEGSSATGHLRTISRCAPR